MNLSGLPDDTDIATGGVDLGGLPDDNARLLRQQYRATQGTPDEAAKAFDLSKRSGVPKPVVERNRAEIERIAGEPDWGALEATAPVTITQLAGNAKMFELARDDTDNMSAVEQAVRHVVGPVRSLSAGLLTDFNAAAWGLAEGTAKYAGAERLGAAFETLRKGQEALGKTVQGGYGKAGLGEAGVASGFRSFGAMIPGTVAAVLTGSPQIMLATGSAQAGGQAVGKGLDKGLPPAQALLYGAEDALAEYATELIPVTRLFKDLKAGTPFLKLLGRQIATEVPTELAATAWQNFNEWANINPEKSLETYLNELGPAEAETVIATVTQTILSAGLAKGAARLNRQFEDKRQAAATAEQDAAALQEISKLAAASKLRARDPQSFEQFVGAASEDGPVQEVYLDARALQQAGVDMQALAQASPAAAAQVEEALATGGDIVIPVSEYASRVAGGELDTMLTSHLRTSEEGLSLDEAQRFYQGMQQEMQQSAQQAMAEHEADTAWQQSAKEVETELTRQLQQTGRFTQDVNTAYATLMRDFYVATAQRLGVTPTEMFQRYPIRVAAESVAGAQRMEQGNAEESIRTAFEALPSVSLGTAYPITVEFNGRKQQFMARQDALKGRNPRAALHLVHLKRGRMIAGGVEQWLAQEYKLDSKNNLKPNGMPKPLSDEEAAQFNANFPQSNPLQRFAQSVAKALGLQQETPAPAQEPATPGGPVLDMGQFFQGQADVPRYSVAPDPDWKSLETAGPEEQYAAFRDWATQMGWDVRLAGASNTTSSLYVDVYKPTEYDAEYGVTADERAHIRFADHSNRRNTDASTSAELSFNIAPGIDSLAEVADAIKTWMRDAAGPDILKQGQGNRAEISFAKDITAAPSVITLFKNADLSSFLHEMGHFQLEVLANIASQPDAPQAIVDDFNAALDWFKPGMAIEQWNAMSLEDKRPYHEQFARGFEAYLFEGKAPNAELDSLFARVRAWLTNVYKSVKALNVEISDDIRRVFDRLIATQDAIDQAEAVRSYAPLFTEAPGSMDPAAWGQYQDLASEATQNAITDMQKRSLRDMQWLGNARGRVLKQLQADAKDKRKSVEAEVRAEVQAMPVYAAQRFLKRGEIITETGERIQAVKGHKLDNAALAEMYPETMLARPELDGLRGMTRKDGLHPDLVAEMFGFTSGDQLVREILDAQPEAQVIEGMTDQRVLERYGDLASPDTIARAADEAIHNEARARFVATELKALTAAAGPVRAMTKAAKDFAETLIARKKLRDIKPNQHATAETRAAKAAQKALAAGDTALAATEKRNQLVQNYATRTAYNALDEIDKAVKYLRKFDGEGTRKNLDTEYLDQIDQLLERFDLRASTPLSAAKKRANLLAWVESQREQGFEPDIPPDLITEASRKPYRELTLEEMRGLVDTVKQIEHLGRLKKKLLTAKDEREFQAIRDEIAASIEANAKGARDLRTRGTTGAMLKDAGNRFLAMHRKMASVAREMDGFQDGGPMWEYLIRSMNTAGDAETTRRAAATARLHELLKPLLASGPMGGKGIYFEALGGSFNREERIAIALNLGNAGNMQRLLDGEGWTLERLQPLLDTITPEEADFAQGVWDFFESYRPEIAAKELRIYGKEPEWVDPAPVTLGGKTLRGGYYPVKYDTNRSGRAEQFAEAEAAKQQMRGAYTSATTRRSFTKSRAEEVSGRPLLYSFAGIYQGTNEVIHDLSWHEWLIDANRLVRSLDAPIRLHYGPETVSLFKKAIEDIAAGDVPAQNVFEKGINHLRMGTTVAGLGWNFSTALLQPFGLTQSMVRVGPGWVAKGLAQWVKSPIDTGEEVQEKSAFMRDRARTMQREINEIQNQVRGAKLDPVRATFFLFIQKAQMVADMPTWLGAYEKATAEGNAEERAVALADQAVMDAQGGGQIKDLAQIQRGGPLLKLWTNFYSFFNTTYNLAVEKTKQKGGDTKLYPSLAMDYLLLFVVPSVMVTLLKAALQGGEDDEDKLVKKIIADQMSYLLGTMVGLREITAAAQKVAGVEQFKGSYGGPAGLRMFQEIDKLATQTAQGEADAAFFKAANNAAGNLMHYPSGQINRTVEGTAALIEGKTANPAALVFGPPKP